MYEANFFYPKSTLTNPSQQHACDKMCGLEPSTYKGEFHSIQTNVSTLITNQCVYLDYNLEVRAIYNNLNKYDHYKKTQRLTNLYVCLP